MKGTSCPPIKALMSHILKKDISNKCVSAKTQISTHTCSDHSLNCLHEPLGALGFPTKKYCCQSISSLVRQSQWQDFLWYASIITNFIQWQIEQREMYIDQIILLMCFRFTPCTSVNIYWNQTKILTILLCIKMWGRAVWSTDTCTTSRIKMWNNGTLTPSV